MSSLEINGFEIHDGLLEKKAITRCALAQCKGGCCADGVWVDLHQADRILDQADMIKPHLPPERRDTSTWFAELHDDDPSFPSGKYTGTTTVADASHPSGTTCVFLRPEDRFCAIQYASFVNGHAPWALKPHYCCLFPVVDEHEYDERNAITRKVLLLDSENDLFSRGGGCYAECASEPEYVFQIYAEEVALALGIDGYHALCAAVGVEPRL